MIGPHVFKTVENDRKNTGGGIFLTEFGLCIPDGNKNSVNTIECSFVLNEADKYLHSWTYWDSEFFCKNDSINENVIRVFSRPYPQIVAGTPQKMSFDDETGHFNFVFLLDASLKKRTYIYLPTVHYPSLLNVKIKSDIQVTWIFNSKTHLLEIFHEDKNARGVHSCRVTVTP